MTAFFGTAWGKAMWAARPATRSKLNLSGIATEHVITSYSIHYTKLYDLVWDMELLSCFRYPGGGFLCFLRNNFV